MSQPLETQTGEVVSRNPEIERPLREGNTLHAFSSGGSLRVVRIEDKAGELVSYGEAPQIEDAMAHAALNYQLRETYEQQYSGENARYTYYLTGTTELSSPLDAHIRWGGTFDAHSKDGDIVVSLSGPEQVPNIPKDIQDKVAATGQATIWEERGVKYEVTQTQFANLEHGVSTKAVEIPEGVNPWMFRYTQTGAAPTFEAAVIDAFGAPQTELMPPATS